MKSKLITGYTERGFEKKMDAFTSQKGVEILEIKFSTPIFFYTALILYKNKDLN